MKNLFFKELRLVVTPGTYFFALCAALILVPAYPYAVGMSYCLMSILINFGAARANNDQEFTAMLPIPRSRVVLAKHMTVFITELMTLLIAVPCALVSAFVLNPNGNIVGMDANMAFFGFTLIEYSVFNIIFLPWYFRTGYKTGMPMTVGITAYLLTVVGFELMVAFTPGLSAVIDSLHPTTFVYQGVILAAGLIVYLLVSIITYLLSVRNFAKVSL